MVKAIRDSDLLIQLALKPECRLRYELPYLDGIPLSLGELHNPYTRSILCEKLSTLSPRQTISDEVVKNIETDSEKLYFIPYNAAVLEDSRIQNADISYWTNVSSDNSVLRELLEIYFVSEYPFHQYFHKNLFLEDLSHGRTRFCSRTLVNALLAAAWVNNSRLVRYSTHKADQSIAWLSKEERPRPILDARQPRLPLSR